MGRFFSLLMTVALGTASAVSAEKPPRKAPAAHLLGFSLGDFTLEIPVALTARVEEVSGYPLDRYDTHQPAGLAVSPRARIGLKLDSETTWEGFRLRAEYEHDVPTGTWTDRAAVGGLGMPDSEAFALALRKANVRAQFGESVHAGLGVMTSHWGLGLLANDGDHGWAPGNARFSDPRGGDRVLRAYVGTVPRGELGLAGLVAADLVWDDDVLLTKGELPTGMDSDKAWQAVAALTIGHATAPRSGGLYVVHRRQQAADGRMLQVTGIDATGRARFSLAESIALELAFEAAFLAGSTDFAASPDYPSQSVRQLGVAARGTLDAGRAGAVLDVLFASGDQNTDDRSQNAFRPDPNYEMGLFLYRHVLAAQTARGFHTAGDPDIVGYPSQGLERVPSRGSATNTLAIFPRGYFRPLESLEIYGGPLIALSPVPFVDPFNSRVAGGTPHNALDASPGLYLGTEVDLGVRWRFVRGVHALTIGAEGGVLVPGSAFLKNDGQVMAAVMGARGVVDYRF